MSKNIIVASFAFFTVAACATGGTIAPLGGDRESAPRSKVELDLSPSTGANPVFPAAIDPALPSVDRIAHQVRSRLGTDAIVALQLCVAPDGHVTKVSMLDGTQYEPFDAAVVRDAEQWRFTAMPGPATLQTCERVTLKYIAPR